MICVFSFVYTLEIVLSLSVTLRGFSFQALQSDIDLRKKNVEQAVCNGMELLKQTTGMCITVLKTVQTHLSSI